MSVGFCFYMCDSMNVYIINCILWIFRVTTIYPVQDRSECTTRSQSDESDTVCQEGGEEHV